MQTASANPDVRTPILIVGNAGFTFDNGVNGGGSGTILDPYIIENWEISAGSAHGIRIENTTAYFVVRNCVVENGAKAYNGIHLYNVVNGRIENNTCRNDNYGIYLRNSSYDNLTGNTCENDNYGIYMDNSSYDNLTGNTCRNDNNYGIYMYPSCHYNNLTGNTCENIRYGIYLRNSNYDNLTNNTISKTTTTTQGAIYLYSDNYLKLTGNIIENNLGYGIYMYTACHNNTLENNTCSKNKSGIYMTSDNYNNLTGNICSNNTGPGDNYGIHIFSGCYYNNLIGNTCENNGSHGIYMQQSPNPYNNLTNNNCSNNSGCGIWMSGCHYENLIGNTCENDNHGIYLQSSDNYAKLTGNTCSNNLGYGIYVGTSCYYDNLTGNTCSNNWTGIRLSDSYYDNLTGNTIDNNVYNFSVTGSTIPHFDHNIDNSNLINGKPIYYIKDQANLVIGSDIGYLGLVRDNNIIVENLVLGNNGQGILLVSTKNSRVENCIFSNNSEYGIQMYNACNYDNLIGNTIENTSGTGINMTTGDNYNNVIGNTCSNNTRGISLSTYSCYNNITGNTIKNHSYCSIYASTSSFYNNVTYNICENDNLGMYFNPGSYENFIGNTCSDSTNGIYLASTSTYNNVIGNTCENNRRGIYVVGAGNNNIICQNTCENNENGIYIRTASNNRICHNNLVNNSVSQASDNSTNNWDNGYPSGGNYWSDYTGVDIYSGENQNIPGGDNIGDNRYDIPGKTPPNQDRYPLLPSVCGVDVTIENALLESWPSQYLAYTIDVHNSGNILDNIILSYIPDGWPDIVLMDNLFTDVAPCEHRQTTLLVHVPDGAVECTYKEITVVAESQFCGATDNDSALAHVIPQPICLVDVTIENKLLEGLSSTVLVYTIDVHNNGNSVDNIILSYIPDGWPDIVLMDNLFTDVAPCEHRQATMFVHVPYGVIGCTYKEITVVAESQFCGATDNDIATAHVQEVCGVDVIIENKLLEGPPSTFLAYTISVHNSGNVVDNINLSYIPDGWPNINIIPTVLIDVAPCEWRQATMFVHVPDNAMGCTYKEITVVAESQFCHVTDNDAATAHVQEVCGVDVTIVDKLLEGWPSQVLAYTIDVHNSGNVVDNIILSYIPDGWPDIVLMDNLFTDVAPCEHRQTTLLVHVPDNAVECTYKEITVVAESQFCHVTDNDTAQAHVLPTPICLVDVTIENKLLEGSPSTVLVYTIDVHNSGNYPDNINLSYIPDGWPDITIVPPVLINVLPSEHRQATMFVHVPDNAVPCTYKEITVVAESQACGATDNDTAQANVIAAPVVTYTYVSSYSAVKGTVTDFDHQQAADDDELSTLAERVTTSGSPLYYLETFEHGGAIPDGWALMDGFAIRSTAAGNHTPGGTYSSGITAGVNSTNRMISCLIDYTSKSNVHLDFWYRGTATSVGSWIKVDASIDGGATYTVPVVAQFNILYDSVFHQVGEDQDLSSLANQPNVKFRWTVFRTGGNINLDDILFTATELTAYDMEIYENITGVPSADNHTLEMRYKLVNTKDNFNVQVWDGSAWNTRGSALNSTSWTDWSYMLLGSEVIGGTVQVRFVDVNPSSTQQDNILKDYLRVKGVAAAYFGVDVTIVEDLLEGWLSQVLAYTIDVHNSGNVVDNINLSYIPDGWPDITIVPQVLTDVMPCEHRQATMFVHVPYGVIGCTYKEITVVAESQFCGVTDNDSALAHVLTPPPWTGSATFRLETLYKLNLYKDNLWLNMGSKLVVKFYKYDNTFEDENVIHIFTPPWHVVPENENVAYPGENIGIKKAKLWLVDNENNEISKITGWETIRDDLWPRLIGIRTRWPYAGTPERDALWKELIGIRVQWPYAPTTRDPIWEDP